MIGADRTPSAFDGSRPAALAVGALLVLLPLLPPEVHGTSLAACAALVGVAFVASLPGGSLGIGHVALLVAAAASPWLIRRAASPGEAVAPIALAILMVAAGLASHRIARAGRWTSWRWLLAAVGALVAARALYDRLGGLALLRDELVGTATGLPDAEAMLRRLEENRAYGGFVTPAALAGFLALGLPSTVGLALGARGRRRGLAAAVAGLELAGVAATASLTASAALVLVAIAFLVVRPGGGSGRRVAFAAAVVLGLLVAGGVALRGRHVVSLDDPESPWRLRAGNVRIATEIAAAQPWLGAGPGGYAELYPRLRRPGDNEARHAHALPFELAAEYGLIVGGLLTALFLYVFLAPCLAAHRTRDPATTGLTVGLAVFAVQNLGDFTAFLPSVAWPAAILAGIAWPESDRAPEPRAGGAPLLRIAIAVVVVVAALAASGHGWRAESLFEARAALANGDHRAAREAAERAVRFAPWSPDAVLFRAQLLEREAQDGGGESGRRAAALAEYDRAVDLAPERPAARALRARMRVTMGDLPGAYADLVEATRLYPMKQEYARDRDAIRALLPDPRRRATTP